MLDTATKPEFGGANGGEDSGGDWAGVGRLIEIPSDSAGLIVR